MEMDSHSIVENFSKITKALLIAQSKRLIADLIVNPETKHIRFAFCRPDLQAYDKFKAYINQNFIGFVCSVYPDMIHMSNGYSYLLYNCNIGINNEINEKNRGRGI